MRSININELQSQVSQVIKDVEKGEKFEVIRYSEPVAVVLSKKEFEKMKEELEKLRSSCRGCVEEFVKNKRLNIKNKKHKQNI